MHTLPVLKNLHCVRSVFKGAAMLSNSFSHIQAIAQAGLTATAPAQCSWQLSLQGLQGQW